MLKKHILFPLCMLQMIHGAQASSTPEWMYKNENEKKLATQYNLEDFEILQLRLAQSSIIRDLGATFGDEMVRMHDAVKWHLHLSFRRPTITLTPLDHIQSSKEIASTSPEWNLYTSILSSHTHQNKNDIRFVHATLSEASAVTAGKVICLDPKKINTLNRSFIVLHEITHAIENHAVIPDINNKDELEDIKNRLNKLKETYSHEQKKEEVNKIEKLTELLDKGYYDFFKQILESRADWEALRHICLRNANQSSFKIKNEIAFKMKDSNRSKGFCNAGYMKPNMLEFLMETDLKEYFLENKIDKQLFTQNKNDTALKSTIKRPYDFPFIPLRVTSLTAEKLAKSDTQQVELD